MDTSHSDVWPTLDSVFDLMVFICLTVLDAINHAAHIAGPSIWAALDWVGHALSIAGNALLAAVLILLWWIFVIYLCCFTICIMCKMVRWYTKKRGHGERQPLLPPPQRRRRLPSWTPSNWSDERRRHHDHQAHRDLARLEISRRRQDILRREQHRAIEIRSREYRERRLRQATHHQPSTTPFNAQHQTIITWLHASSRSTVITHQPMYGTLPARAPQPRSERRADPPPPYSQNTREQPPPYSNFRNDSPPAYG